MIGTTRSLRVFAYGAPADLRMGYEGLSGLVVSELRRDVLSGDCYLFTNRTRTRAKVIFWDGTGLCILQKRLEEGRFACLWKTGKQGGPRDSIELTMSELALFIEGSEMAGVSRSHRRKLCCVVLRRCARCENFDSPVINLVTETDIERVRQVAILLERENSRLHKRLEELVEKLARAEGKDATTLQLEIAFLKETLERQNRALFGTSSEKRRSGRSKDDQQRQAQRGHGPSAQPKLPIVEVVHALDAADKACPSCGGEMSEMAGQFEESEEVDVVERSFRLVRHKRTKYRCSCCCAIETAPGPPKLIDGGRYSIAFAVEVALEKYLQHMPLTRQVRQMERQGLTVSTQTFWDQLSALSEHLRPSYAALREVVLSSLVVGADETTWRLMEGGESKTWWAWSVSSHQGVYHHIHATRSVEAAEAILGSYAGVVVCDGYTAYSALEKKRRHAREGPAPPVLAHCWSHVRRKFFEAEPNDRRATEALELIGKLFAIEAEANETANGDLRARRIELRGARSREVIAELRRWMLAQRALPKSALGRAISYADGMWEGLCRFLEYPDAPIHNNQSERALRGIALGRKNHYGSRSHRGTLVAALCYSMIESARVAGVDPGKYLREAAERAIANPGTVTLPHHLLNS